MKIINQTGTLLEIKSGIAKRELERDSIKLYSKIFRWLEKQVQLQ
jgi:hypothetical protein